MTEQTIKCPICAKPYVVYSHFAGDQSACPSCRREARGGDKSLAGPAPMNYRQARQVDPAADREDAGKWRWTCMNDGRVWPEGPCAEGCPGHDTAEEACQHYVEGVIAQGIRWTGCSWTSCNNRPECPNPANRMAHFNGDPWAAYTFCNQHDADNIAEGCYRLDHQGNFSEATS